MAPTSSSPWQTAPLWLASTKASSTARPARTAARHMPSMWPSSNEHVRLAVVGAERAALRAVAPHHRHERLEVAGIRRLADENPGAVPALLEGLLEGGGLVVRPDAGGEVGIQRVSADARRVAVDVTGAAGTDLPER